MTPQKNRLPSTPDGSRVHSPRPLPRPPQKTGKTESGPPTIDTAGHGGAPGLQSESSNLSYRSEGEGSYHSDDASSGLSVRTEECSVEFAELLSLTDPTTSDPLPSPKPADTGMSLQDFLSELKPEDLKRITRQSAVRHRFASQSSTTRQQLDLAGLRLPTAVVSQQCPSQASLASTPRPTSPRPFHEVRSAPHTPEKPGAHGRSGSMGTIPEGKVLAPTSPHSPRQRQLGKKPAIKQRLTPNSPSETAASTPQRPASHREEIAQLEEDLKDLGQLADEMLAIAEAGPKPLMPSAEKNPGVPEKPPANH